MLVLFGAREDDCVAALYSDHYREVPLSQLLATPSQSACVCVCEVVNMKYQWSIPCMC